MLRFVFLSLISLSLFCATPAEASISLSDMVVEFFQKKKPIKTITVTNTDKENTVVVDITAFQDLGFGQPEANLIETKRVSVAPRGVELKPGESRDVRIFLRKKPTDKLDVYRVRFIPKAPPKPSYVKKVDKVTASISIVVGFGVLVLAEPENPQANLTYTREADKIHFKNAGNTYAVIERTTYCDATLPECVEVDGKRVLPNTNWTMELPKELGDKDLTISIKKSGAYEKVTIPAN